MSETEETWDVPGYETPLISFLSTILKDLEVSYTVSSCLGLTQVKVVPKILDNRLLLVFTLKRKKEIEDSVTIPFEFIHDNYIRIMKIINDNPEIILDTPGIDRRMFEIEGALKARNKWIEKEFKEEKNG